LAIECGQILPDGIIQRIRHEVKTVAKTRGFLVAILVVANYISRRAINRIKLSFWYNCNRLLLWRSTFLFQGNTYRYFLHKYNLTWRNERIVEIPIVRRLLQETDGDVLEIGNVLSHYFEVKHDIIDKYEHGKGVITQDVTSVETTKRYDLIVSISTLEHVGWDENPDHCAWVEDPEKILKAISKLRSLLKPKGKIVITVPLGYNPHLDRLLKTGKLMFDKQLFMKRTNGHARWTEATWNQVKVLDFNMRVPTANAILIGVLEN
jgi:hypothetical protein